MKMERDKFGRFVKGIGFWKGKKRPGFRNAGTFKKGHTPWNKGNGKGKPKKKKRPSGELRNCEWCKKPRYFKHSLLKKNKWFFCSLDCYHRFLKGKRMSPKTEFKAGMPIEKHPRWLGGKSFEPYGIEFNEKLRELIRERDNHKCFICGKKDYRKLSVHHIDYNKKNNNPNNLISLCNKCHIQTNSNRIKWKKFFQELLGGQNG